MTTPNTCPDCHHATHKPGQCARDNCGQSLISHGDATLSDRGLVVTEQLFQRGEVLMLDIKHIRPRKARG